MRIKIPTILMLCLAGGGVVFGAEQIVRAKQRRHPMPVREGFVFDGVEGTITRAGESRDKWFFAADVEVSDGRAVIKAGQAVELLPSATLETITANIDKGKTSTDVRLWATVTRYSNRNLLAGQGREDISLHKDFFDKNFLFAWYFIPTSSITEPPGEIKTDQSAEPGAAEAGQPDESIIPANVMEMLKPKRMVNLAKLKKLDIKGDVMLADRTGFVLADDKGKLFGLDGLGRNVEDISFRLLPCEVLERVEANLARSAGQQRYRIAGRVTKYKGALYILLQRAVRTYSHGNFAR
jgi:hypothetical protein